MDTKIKFFKNAFQKNNKKNVYIDSSPDAYVDNFGKQWESYRDVQIDSKNKFQISKNFLEDMIFSDLKFLQNKTILEIGCGAGRFTEYFVKYGKECVAIDLSSAIYHNVALDNDNLYLIKSDFNKLIPDDKFDIVFCRGVLQHTPNPYLSIKNLYKFVKKNGHVFFDIYSKPKIGIMHPKYLLWRPLIKILFKYESFEAFLKNNIRFLLKIKRLIKKIFFNSNFISDSIIPIWDYKGNLPLNENQLENWSILDTLDGIYSKYDYPQKYNQIKLFLDDNRIKIIDSNIKLNCFKTSI